MATKHHDIEKDASAADGFSTDNKVPTPTDDISLKVEEPLDPFGNEDGKDVKCEQRFWPEIGQLLTKFLDKTMTWWQGAMVMLAENISLGILSLPAVLAKNGLIGGLIAIIGLGMFSTYSGYVLWQFKMKHPQVHNYADIGGVMFGPIGEKLFGAAYIIYMVFCMASHILTFTIALNVLTNHATCTIVWGVIGLVVFSIVSIPRTLKNVSFLSIVSFTSILSAVVLTMVALGVSPRAAAGVMSATTHPSFPSAFNSMSNVVFAYAGHVAWISFISELKDQRDFPKALIAQQSMDIVLYTVASIVIYRYAGNDVASPALSSNGPLIRKIAWGIALPTIIIAGVIFAHVSAKYVYLRIFSGTKYLHSRGFVATGTWIGIGTGFWVVAWIIAESIPNFSDLLGFISALFASWFSYGIPGICWFMLNRNTWNKGWKKLSLSVVNGLLVCLGLVICGAGLYSSGYEMNQNAAKGASWSCADNQE